MPVNKEALIRYRAINKALLQHRIASQDVLIRYCAEAIGTDVAWRTVAGDINAMRHDELLAYFAPIENVRNEGYRYTDKNYSIDQIPLQDEEVTALSFAAKLLMQYSHVKIFSTVTGAIDKLNQNLDVQLKNRDVANLGDLISFEETTSDGGSVYLTELLDHIRLKTVLSVEYHSFSSGSKKTHLFHPYYIKEYRNRWYVLGYLETYRELRTLALERILKLEPSYGSEFHPPEFDVAAFFRDAIGVSVNNSLPQNVQLKVSNAQFQYLESQPLHHSQQLVKQDEAFSWLTLYVIINYELKSVLLSMGAAVEVLKPLKLKQALMEEAGLITNNYDH